MKRIVVVLFLLAIIAYILLVLFAPQIRAQAPPYALSIAPIHWPLKPGQAGQIYIEAPGPLNVRCEGCQIWQRGASDTAVNSQGVRATYWVRPTSGAWRVMASAQNEYAALQVGYWLIMPIASR